jgi:hypothetical protein
MRVLRALTGGTAAASAAAAPHAAASPLHAVLRLFTPPARVSARGNALTEQFDFSERSWKNLFRRNGLVVEACLPNRLFYTGHLSLGPRLQMQTRTALSYLLGSAGKVYVVRPAQ